MGDNSSKNQPFQQLFISADIRTPNFNGRKILLNIKLWQFQGSMPPAAVLFFSVSGRLSICGFRVIRVIPENWIGPEN
jgi:hypothetical protein